MKFAEGLIIGLLIGGSLRPFIRSGMKVCLDYICFSEIERHNLVDKLYEDEKKQMCIDRQ